MPILHRLELASGIEILVRCPRPALGTRDAKVGKQAGQLLRGHGTTPIGMKVKSLPAIPGAY